MIEAVGLTKHYGPVVAVDDLSFSVPSGQVTGFLGPNGAGKSTTMRMILGLDAPTSGTVTVGGRAYASYARPLRQVGALLDAGATHPGRSAFHHLMCLAVSNGIGRSRVKEVLGLVGLSGAAGRRTSGFSLGMAQRLGVAAALLGDPPVLVLDEPVNGLDPEGVLWVRTLMRSLAAEGRAVLLSSHLMSEVSLTADRLVIVGRGRLLAETTLAELLASSAGSFVRVRSPQAGELAELLAARGATVARHPDGALGVTGLTSEEVGDIARGCGATLQELSEQRSTLEDAYLELTRESLEFSAADVSTGSIPRRAL